MRVFVAGATGALGSRLVPRLVARGHQVVGTTRTPSKVERLRAQGADGVVLDALDAPAVKDAVVSAAPEVVVHELTSIPPTPNPKRLDDDFALTNRLRTEGTDHLLEAAHAAGVRRFVNQSYAAWPYTRTGGPIKTEEDPLDDDPPPQVRRTLAAILYLEHATLTSGMDGVVLRYGGFYGPGTSLTNPGPFVEVLRKRKFPIVGSGAGVWSFVQIDDAAEATALAVETGAPGIYNVTDDEPAPVREFLPVLAEAVGAPRPRHVPVWLARMFVGEVGISMMTAIRGASNAKAKRDLHWRLAWPTWRDGFRRGLTD